MGIFSTIATASRSAISELSSISHLLHPSAILSSAGIILVKSNPLDVVKIFTLSRASYRKMAQNLVWATGYNVVALPLAAGILAPVGILLSPALGALFMSLSTVIVALNAQLLRRTDIGAV